MMLVKDGRVLNPANYRFELADILVDADRIVDITAPGAVSAEGRQVVDATDRLVIPGLVNGHNHAQTNLSEGIADRWTLEILLANAS